MHNLSNPWNTNGILIRNGGLDMINNVINEIIRQLGQLNIKGVSVNKDQLQKLYHTLETYSIKPENHFSYFVSYGLLLLHLDTHHQLNDSSTETQCKNIILYGDLFYSLYYDYTIRHAFTLITNNIFKHLKKYEISSIYQRETNDILNAWVDTIVQEEGYDELSI